MECGVRVKKWTACHPYPMDDTRPSNPNGPSPLKKAVHAMYDGGVSRHLTHDSCPLPPSTPTPWPKGLDARGCVTVPCCASPIR